MPGKLKLNKIIERANIIHNNFYDYSKFIHNSTKKGIIICPVHGEFKQTASHHLAGHGCNQCAKIKRAAAATTSIQEFVNKANKLYNNFYNYSLVKFKTLRDTIKIICPQHGIFFQKANEHLQGHKCKKCSINGRLNKLYNNKERLKIIQGKINNFIVNASKFHNNKYNF